MLVWLSLEFGIDTSLPMQWETLGRGELTWPLRAHEGPT
jgi:hypothetical protein